ncbi:MAG: sugar transferase [Bryobacteraceae bacterium]
MVDGVLVLICVIATLHGAVTSSFRIDTLIKSKLAIGSLLMDVLFALCWLTCFLEDNIRLKEEPGKRIRRFISRLVLLSFGMSLIVIGSEGSRPLARTLTVFWIWSCALIVARRARASVLQHFAASSSSQNVLILGTGPAARKAWKELRTNHYVSARMVGFVDSVCLPTAPTEIRSMYLGSIEDLEEILLRYAIDLVVVALPAKSCYDSIQRAISTAEQAGAELITFDAVFQSERSDKFPRGLRPLFYAPPVLQHELAQAGKRLFDVSISVFLLIALAPLFAVLAIAIKLASPGPVLFVQERYGYRRRKFRMFKFRTMVVNAEALLRSLEIQNEAVGPIFKIKADPRITSIGRLLRKTSLDELPQLWNVLTGSMSLVGPRPMSVRDVSLFSNSYLFRRFKVKPGITGLWQVSGRSNTTFDEWIKLDFSYIDRWSLSLDFAILLKTIPAVLRGSGAH